MASTEPASNQPQSPANQGEQKTEPETPTRASTGGSMTWPQFLALLAIAGAIYFLYLVATSFSVRDFLIWEVLLSLAPILLALFVFQFFGLANWQEFIGGGDSLPIAMVITAVAMRRILLSGASIPDFWLAIGVIILIASGFVYVFANLNRRQKILVLVSPDIWRNKLPTVSIALTVLAIIYGTIIARMSGKG